MTVAATLLIAAAPHSGGWSVVTVRDLPTHLVAGTPTTITFAIRGHGERLSRGLTPTVSVKRTRASMLAPRERPRVTETRRPGEYQFTFTPEETAAVTVTIHQVPNVELLPIPVVAAGVDAAPPAPEAYGQALFVAKGCVTCHVKADDPTMLDRGTVNVGPVLTGRRFEVDWLTTKITDPSINRVRFNEYATMPTLDLTVHEVAALVAYVNHRVVASR
jgi:mono/diheme cytochrome c family protein